MGSSNTIYVERQVERPAEVQRRRGSRPPWLLLVLGACLSCASLVGCEMDSFFNPSVTGYWENTPTTIPILERIDVIEQDEEYWGQISEVSPEDLVPSDLSYRAVPGDFVTVQVFELFREGEWSTSTRRIDAGGFLRIPKVGEIPAAGRTPQEIEDILTEILLRDYLARPQVDIVVEEGTAFNYTMYGAVRSPSMYNLVDPDLRLLDALALAGGAPNSIKDLYVIRQVVLSESVKPGFDQVAPVPRTPAAPPDRTPVDIDDLIEQIGQDPPPAIAPPAQPRTPAPSTAPEVIDPPIDIDDLMDDIAPNFSPGVLRQDGEPIIDIDQLEPARPPGQPEIDIDTVRRGAEEGGTWMFVEERGEWIRVAAGESVPEDARTTPSEPPLYVERIIRIPVDRLRRGDSRYNIVVRPNDRIFVEPPPEGVVYIEGQILRAGSFSLPSSGITLSRLVASAGGLGQLAIPDRVDLIRKVGPNREAAVRLNLAAIRHRTEPDIVLKPDDHIIIGTNFVATPLAVIRNGFRATYGFGLLLDRNFGNDVFGVPPGFSTR